MDEINAFERKVPQKILFSTVCLHLAGSGVMV